MKSGKTDSIKIMPDSFFKDVFIESKVVYEMKTMLYILLTYFSQHVLQES